MPTIDVDTDEVEQRIRSVAAAEVEPRFGHLGDGDVTEKEPGDLVTVADRACEAALAAGLRSVLDVPVVGEEASFEDPSLLDLVASAGSVWVLDPIDGTTNFAAGSTDHAVLVSLVQRGRVTDGWMYLPASGSMLRARLGGGAWRDGRRVEAVAPSAGAVGLLKRGYLPAPIRAALDRAPSILRDAVHGRGCCPLDYHDVVTGAAAFALYWRTLPWDHTAAALYATEAGLRVARPGGRPYEPGDGACGLLVAHPSRWDDVDVAFGALR